MDFRGNPGNIWMQMSDEITQFKIASNFPTPCFFIMNKNEKLFVTLFSKVLNDTHKDLNFTKDTLFLIEIFIQNDYTIQTAHKFISLNSNKFEILDFYYRK
jgi:hypothetical protein